MLKINRHEKRLTRIKSPAAGHQSTIAQTALREAISNSPWELFAELGTEPMLWGRDVPLSAASRETADLLALSSDGRAHIVLLPSGDGLPVLFRALLFMAEISRWRYPDFVKRLDGRTNDQQNSNVYSHAGRALANYSLSLVSDRFDFETLTSVEWLKHSHQIEIQCLRPLIAWDQQNQSQYIIFQAAQSSGPSDYTAESSDPPAVSGSNGVDHYLNVASGWSPFQLERNTDGFRAVDRRKKVGLAAVWLLPFAALAGTVLWTRESAPSWPRSQVFGASVQRSGSRLPASLSGVVVDRLTGAPLSNSQVSYGDRTALTDSSGRFAIGGRRVGGRLFARAAGYRQNYTAANETFTTLRLDPLQVRALYVSHASIDRPAGHQNFRRFIRDTSSNAVVFEVKGGDGRLHLQVDHPLAGVTGGGRPGVSGFSREAIAEWKAAGIYTIALVSLFKDGRLASSKPSLALRGALSNQMIRDSAGIGWVDPALASVRDYNIAVAKAAAEAGFDEILFDFIRYPAEEPSREGASPAEYLSRLAVLSDFLREVRRAIQPFPVYLSASMFGQTCTSSEIGVTGQRIEEFGAELDYICPMLYPSQFRGQKPYTNPLLESFQIVFENVQSAASRLGGDRARIRPWLQNFPDSGSPNSPLRASIIRKQISAARFAGASGWMLWDARNRYQNTLEAVGGLTDTGLSEVRSFASQKSGPWGTSLSPVADPEMYLSDPGIH